MKKICFLHFVVAGLGFLLLLSSPATVSAQTGDWKVWVKTTPCSGRFDWITVAKDNPTGGSNFYYQADFIFPGTSCTRFGCTFAEATAVAATLRPSPEFSKYCCHDYSVWENSQTGKRSVVLGKFGNAGFGWTLVKGDLCCEDAEVLAGIPGACSGSTANNHKEEVKKADCSSYPGSYAVWNDQTKQVECWCPPGMTWNSTNTACIDIVAQKDNCWPGSYAAYNPQTKQTECYCNPGLVWNSTKTACIDPKDLVKNTDCSMYPGSYAAWNDQTQRVECWCPAGKTWNSTNTACIDIVAQKDNCWPGSYAAYNPQTKQTECYCNPGLVWNSTKTACIDPKDLVKNTDCSMYPGSYAAWNDQTQRVECWCPAGKVWNSTNTACVDASGNNNNNSNNNNNNNNNNNTGNPTWTLVSVTSVPETPAQGWSFSARGGTAHYDVYNGDKGDFQWTAPPQQFNSSGFTISLSVQSHPVTPKGRMASLIGVAADGLTSDTKDQSAYADAPDGGPSSAQKKVTFKPDSGTGEVEVRVELMWGSVKCYYKYKRM